MRETDVVVVGAGPTGMSAAVAAVEAGARVLVLEKGDSVGGAPGLKILSRAMVLDVILSPEGDVAGALVADEDAWEVQPVRAKAVILTGGGIDALYPDPRDARLTGDAFAIAHRAGADLRDARAEFAEGAVLAGGIETDRDGATRVPGLYAAGLASAERAEGRFAGARAASELPDAFPPFGAYRVVPNVDSRLPEGFADAKFDRLRAITYRHFGPLGVNDAKTGIQHLLRLKGEADEFARARVDSDLFSLQNAVEVALLIARAAEGKDA